MKSDRVALESCAPRSPSPRGRRRITSLLITLVVAAALAIPAYSSRSALAAPSKLTSITIQLSWLNNVEFAGFYVATARGYFKKYGLSVKTDPGGTTIDPRSVVANGAALIGTVAVGTDEAIADSHGADLQAFGAIYQKNPACFMVRAHSGIHNAQGFRGKTIGLQNPARDQVIGILNYNHVPLSAVKLLTVGFDPTPFALGKVDAYTAFAFNEPVAMEMKGIKVRCLINPKLRIGGLVQIDNKDIQRAQRQVDYKTLSLSQDEYTSFARIARIDGDGFYRLYVAEYTGDTRGDDWYADLTCLAVDMTVPADQSVRAGATA